MKNLTTTLCILLLAVTASVASAAPGVNLKWNECFGDAGVTGKTFACNVNTGTSTMMAGFELGADLATVSGLEIVIDLATASPTLPAWWGFKNAGTCRTGSLSIGAAPSANAVNCADWSGGLAQGTSIAAYQVGAENTARILEVTAVPANSPQDLFGGQEYFASSTAINNLKSVGVGSCAGCSTPACIVLNSVLVATPPVFGQPSRDTKLSGPTDLAGTSNFITWQGGAGITVTGKPSGCPAAVPTHTRTWSSIKGLYR